MAQHRVLSQEEREAVLEHIKPQGAFKAPKQRTPFGVQPVAWEAKLGNLDEYREHKGQGRAIVPILSDRAKTAAVQNSILNRLRKLHPDESWSTFVDGKMVFLKFNGPKRTYERTPVDNGGSNDGDGGHGLFAATG